MRYGPAVFRLWVLPSHMATCTFCESDLAPYDPVVVERELEDGREREGVFCNYGCLSAHIEATGAATGACCRIDS